MIKGEKLFKHIHSHKCDEVTANNKKADNSPDAVSDTTAGMTETNSVSSSSCVSPKTSNDSKKPKKVAVLILPDGRKFELPVKKPTIGSEVVLDIGYLSQARVISYDPGFMSTASCQSAITYIDGEKGSCLYRGYPVHKLIDTKRTYLEVCYLLLYAELPDNATINSFKRQITSEMLLHEDLKKIVQAFNFQAHPMSILSSILAAMASFYADPMSGDHLDSWEARELACVRMLAKLPFIVAMIYKMRIGEPIIYPKSELSYVENFLRMMFGKPTEKYYASEAHINAIEAFLIIHADHEQNASTSTVRTAGSSLANPYACMAAGVTSLWGRAHGGANEAVIRMLKSIGSKKNIPKFIEEVKAKKIRLMGFGHRVYRNYDPRASIMRRLCQEFFSGCGRHSPLYDIAMELEKVAIADEYFASRKLYPNVDFYSGIVMKELEIPEEMFTVMFALGRCAGWLAHWKEMVEEHQIKISRPRQLYVGPQEMDIEVEVIESDGSVVSEEISSPFHIYQAKRLMKRAPTLPVDDNFVVDASQQPCADFSTV